ncbi:cytochrome c oxidase assembly protein COX16 homolog, mitochondrial isoform X4 [Tursiops truncatus]|uniref:cytochrome c oxidase assembly protein COX16 homolog, mitochondrial isoform X4 n=1 Tax=Tursiops truncatus TaxID=9739 RepID=UPI003CCF5DCD
MAIFSLDGQRRVTWNSIHLMAEERILRPLRPRLLHKSIPVTIAQAREFQESGKSITCVPKTKTYLQPRRIHSCWEDKQKNHQWIIKSHVADCWRFFWSS